MKISKNNYKNYYNEINLTLKEKENILNNIYKKNTKIKKYNKKMKICISSFLIIFITFFSLYNIYAKNELIIKYDEYFSYTKTSIHEFKINTPINNNYKNNKFGYYDSKTLENNFNLNIITSKYINNKNILITNLEDNLIQLNYERINGENHIEMDDILKKMSYIKITGKFYLEKNKNNKEEIRTYSGDIKNLKVSQYYNQNLKVNMYIEKLGTEKNEFTTITNIYFVYENILYKIKIDHITDDFLWEFIDSLEP